MTLNIGPEGPTTSAIHPTVAPVVLDLEGIQARYGIGSTKAGELVNDPVFPNSVVPGMHRYPVTALEAWELATALSGTVADAARVAPRAPVVRIRGLAERANQCVGSGRHAGGVECGSSSLSAPAQLGIRR